MKQPQEQRDRWLRQAEHDLEVARKHLTDAWYADACYAAEQAAQKALKGFLYGAGERTVTTHALPDLLKQAGRFDGALLVFASGASTLTQYYVATRYPDVIPGSVAPFEVYTKKQAEEAIKIAEDVIAGVRRASAE